MNTDLYVYTYNQSTQVILVQVKLLTQTNIKTFLITTRLKVYIHFGPGLKLRQCVCFFEI